MEKTHVRCECGEWSGERCTWEGPKELTVVVEWMPVSFRQSHLNARSRGSYPSNGAVHIRVERSCADRMLEDDGEWVTEL